MYDKEELLSEADTRTVAEYLGAPLIKRGSTTFTECPGHIINKGRREKKLSHCQISRNGCYCYSCGYSANAIKFAMDYSTNILGIPFTEDDACGLVADTLGGRDLFKHSADTFVPEKKVSHMPLSASEAEVIGLCKKNGFQIITQVSGIKEDGFENAGYYDENENFIYEYHKTQFQPYSLQSLWQDDRKAWKYLVKEKAIEAFQKYDAFQKVFKKSKSAAGMIMANYYLSQAMTALQVAVRFGYKFKKTS